VLEGANKAARDCEYQTPLYLAESKGHTDTVSIFQDRPITTAPKTPTERYLYARTFINDLPIFVGLDRQSVWHRAQAAEMVASEWNMDVSKLIRLAMYDIVILCDNSTSMEDPEKKKLFKDTLQRVGHFAFKLNSTGISLRWLHGPYDSRNLDDLSPHAVEKVIEGMSYMPGSKLGTVLREKIVEPMVLKGAKKREKPLIAVVIIDGTPTMEESDALYQQFLDCKAEGYGGGGVVFLVPQIGKSRGAESFLKELEGREDMRDMVYCSGKKLEELKEAADRNDDKAYTARLLNLFAAALPDTITAPDTN